jgi:hypothetical protein
VPNGFGAPRLPEAARRGCTALLPAMPSLRPAPAEAELRAMKDMLTEVRQSRDDWKAQAERLALTSLAPPPTPAAAPPLPAPRPAVVASTSGLGLTPHKPAPRG